MDIYDYIEIVYRTVLFFVIALASGYIAFTGVIVPSFAFGDTVSFIITTNAVIVWLVFMIGIAAYLIMVAKGSFRPKVEEMEDEEEDDDLDEFEDQNYEQKVL